MTQEEIVKVGPFLDMAKNLKTTTSLIAECFSANMESCNPLLDDQLTPKDPSSSQIIQNVWFKHMLYRQRGLAYLNKHEDSNAMADFDRAIAIFPQDAAEFGLRAIAYANLHQYGKSIADSSHAIGLESKIDAFFLIRGITYMFEGQFQRAISDFDAGLRINPKNADIVYFRQEAQHYLAQGGVSDRSRQCSFRCGTARSNCQTDNDFKTMGGLMKGGLSITGLALGSMFHENCSGNQTACMQNCLR
jgi:tetratricopeptide (TPR) repeat protein